MKKIENKLIFNITNVSFFTHFILIINKYILNITNLFLIKPFKTK